MVYRVRGTCKPLDCFSYLLKNIARNLFSTVNEPTEHEVGLGKILVVYTIKSYYLRYYPLFPYAFSLWPKLGARYGI